MACVLGSLSYGHLLRTGVVSRHAAGHDSETITAKTYLTLNDTRCTGKDYHEGGSIFLYSCFPNRVGTPSRETRNNFLFGCLGCSSASSLSLAVCASSSTALGSSATVGARIGENQRFRTYRSERYRQTMAPAVPGLLETQKFRKKRSQLATCKVRYMIARFSFANESVPSWLLVFMNCCNPKKRTLL